MLHRAALLALPVSLLAAAAMAQNGQAPKQAKPATSPAAPAAPAVPPTQRLGTAEKWIAYTSGEKGGQICYVVGEPQKSEPALPGRAPEHLLVTHNTADKSANVVSFVAGYTFKAGSDAQLEIGGKKFDLFTKDDTAWARDPATDKAIVEAMAKGKQAVLKGTPAKGPSPSDTYALAGFSEVLAMIDKACKIKR